MLKRVKNRPFYYGVETCLVIPSRLPSWYVPLIKFDLDSTVGLLSLPWGSRDGCGPYLPKASMFVTDFYIPTLTMIPYAGPMSHIYLYPPANPLTHTSLLAIFRILSMTILYITNLNQFLGS